MCVYHPKCPVAPHVSPSSRFITCVGVAAADVRDNIDEMEMKINE